MVSGLLEAAMWPLRCASLLCGPQLAATHATPDRSLGPAQDHQAQRWLDRCTSHPDLDVGPEPKKVRLFDATAQNVFTEVKLPLVSVSRLCIPPSPYFVVAHNAKVGVELVEELDGVFSLCRLAQARSGQEVAVDT